MELLLLYLVVLPATFLVVAIRCLVFFPIHWFRNSLVVGLKRTKFSWLIVCMACVYTTSNVTAFSWRHGRVLTEPELYSAAGQFAYGPRWSQDPKLSDSYKVGCCISYDFTTDTDEGPVEYTRTSKYWGDDTYRVELPGYIVYLDKHGQVTDVWNFPDIDRYDPATVKRSGVAAKIKFDSFFDRVAVDVRWYGSEGQATVGSNCFIIETWSPTSRAEVTLRNSSGATLRILEFDFGSDLQSQVRYYELNPNPRSRKPWIREVESKFHDPQGWIDYHEYFELKDGCT